MECVYGKMVYTGHSVLQDQYVCFEGQKIHDLSAEPRGKLLGRFPVLTPAFIDAHSHIGMARAGEPSREAETNEQMETLFALPDALDSIQMDDPAFKDAIEMGVLYSCVLPGSGNIISGLSAVIRHYGKNSTEALVARAGVKAAFGYNPMSTQEWKGQRPSTRMGAAALFRKRLDEVMQKEAKLRRAKGSKKDEITFSAEEKILREVLAKKRVLRAHVHKTDDIAVLLRLVDEFKIEVTVEHAMDVHKPEIFSELKRRNIPVTYGPLDAFSYKVELKHENWRNIRHLVDSKVDFGLMSDHPVTPARQILLQTRWFLRAGLSKQQGVELVSRRNAGILGIDKILGTLGKGKWASFTCWNNDPFDLAGYPVAVYGEGELLFSA
ncbi:MAG: amidohydrolase family protein [Proteobacteria bacterium]|nr:amidohydrolase family protein [Pseudomonadota bacterium]